MTISSRNGYETFIRLWDNALTSGVAPPRYDQAFFLKSKAVLVSSRNRDEVLIGVGNTSLAHIVVSPSHYGTILGMGDSRCANNKSE